MCLLTLLLQFLKHPLICMTILTPTGLILFVLSHVDLTSALVQLKSWIMFGCKWSESVLAYKQNLPKIIHAATAEQLLIITNKSSRSALYRPLVSDWPEWSDVLSLSTDCLHFSPVYQQFNKRNIVTFDTSIKDELSNGPHPSVNI